MLLLKKPIVYFSLSLFSMTACNSQDAFEDAVAYWPLANTEDQAGNNSKLRVHGTAQWVELTNGGSYDGKGVYLDGSSWLNAGQGNAGELAVSGKSITLYAKFKADSISGFHPVFTKSGNDQQRAFSMALNRIDQDVFVEVMIGSDDIGGSHLLKYLLPQDQHQNWQDVLFRFNGKHSELFVNGVLRDKEVTVGDLRDWNTRPVLIGAQYKDPYVEGDSIGNKVEATFRGWIDCIAIWDKALDDEVAANVSGVQQLDMDGLPVYYGEKYRPQFHFTARKNWINDPNGLVYYNGEYHMFFQYMPPHRLGAYKDWGHATSKDLIHWKQDDNHITPHKVWAGCWSGSAIVDHNNVSGFQTGSDKPILAFITSGGRPGQGIGPACTQTIAYSADGGKSFTYYDQNPVIENIHAENRDPKVVWDEQSQQFIMSLFLDNEYDFVLFGSKNLRDWEKLSEISLNRLAECPGFEPFALDGDKNRIKWVFNGASGNYVVGTFDGKVFKPETGTLISDYGANFYAPQIWSDEPNGRKLQIAWMPTNRFPGMPFEQQMNFPTELNLKSTPEGMRLFRLPIAEIKDLYDGQLNWEKSVKQNGENPFAELEDDLYDMELEIDIKKASAFELDIRGATIRYDVSKKQLKLGGNAQQNGFPPDRWKNYVKKQIDSTNNMGEAPLKPVDGKIKLRILVDRTSVEIFANDGLVVFSSCYLRDEQALYSMSVKGEASVKASINALKSIWNNK